MKTYIDLRSDTVTLPTEEMLEAIVSARLGDAVKDEDLTTLELEDYAAGLLGKEAAMLVVSGTMGNLVSILTWARNGRPEMIAEAFSHIILYETAGYARLGSVAARTVKGSYGRMDPGEVEALIRNKANVHHPASSLICVENTHNFWGGTVVTPEQTGAIRRIAQAHGIPMHLDGSRIFNAAKALGLEASELCADFDSVQFCLSKGLSAPLGSMVAGSKAFIEEARYFRKMVGGGMRQSGIIAAAGLTALKNNIDRLVEDHEHARELALGIAGIEGFGVDLDSVQTNIVRVDVSGLGVDELELVKILDGKGVRCGAIDRDTVRFVTHRHISKDHVKEVLLILEETGKELSRARRGKG